MQLERIVVDASDASVAEPALGVATARVDRRARCRPRVSGCSTNTRTRDSSAPLISNDRILRRRADQRDRSRFDVRQKRVLLRLVEAVDLVGEQDRAAPQSSSRSSRLARRSRGRAARLRSRRENGDELAIGVLRDESRERRLARSPAGPRRPSSRRCPSRSPRAAACPARGGAAARRYSSSVRGRMRAASGCAGARRARTATDLSLPPDVPASARRSRRHGQRDQRAPRSTARTPRRSSRGMRQPGFD